MLCLSDDLSSDDVSSDGVPPDVVLSENKGMLIHLEIRRRIHCESTTVLSHLTSLQCPQKMV